MKIGFIGCGNMATAMIQGIVKKGAASPGEVMATARSEATRKKIREELGILLGENNSQAAAFADILFLAVKPRYYEEVIREIRDSVREETLVVSIAPGKTLEWLEGQFEKPVKLIRAMPNTPAMVGEGMTGLCPRPVCDGGRTGTGQDRMRQLRSGQTGDRGSDGCGDQRVRQLSRLCVSPDRGHGGRSGWRTACPGMRLMNLPPRQCWEAPGWCWKQACIRES